MIKDAAYVRTITVKGQLQTCHRSKCKNRLLASSDNTAKAGWLPHVGLFAYEVITS